MLVGLVTILPYAMPKHSHSPRQSSSDSSCLCWEWQIITCNRNDDGEEEQVVNMFYRNGVPINTSSVRITPEKPSNGLDMLLCLKDNRAGGSLRGQFVI